VGCYYQVIKNISIIMIPTEPNNSSAFIAWPGSSSSATKIPHPWYCLVITNLFGKGFFRDVTWGISNGGGVFELKNE
jgi:hypothetical protein